MKLRLLIIAAFLLIVSSANAQYVKVLGIAEKSGTVTVSGIASSNKPSITFPLATITIYSPSGSGLLATIYSDASGTSKANPYSADSSGVYDFFIQPGVTFDVRIAPVGTGVPSPFTRSGYTAAGLPGQTTLACGGTADTALLTAANLLGGTLVIPKSITCATSTITISAPLDIQYGGLLRPITGQTATLTGPQNDGVWQKFTNANATQGTISFAGNTVQKNFQVAWWGANVAAAGAATSAALNAAGAAMPFGSTLHLTGAYQDAGWTIDHKAQLTIIGNDSLDGYIDPGWGPSLTYVGTNGGNHLTLNNCYGCTLRGFLLQGAVTDTVPGTTGAAKNLYVTMTPGGDPPISSQNVYQSLKIQPNNTRADYRAIDVDNASASNNEFHQFVNLKLFGGSQGFGLNTGTGLYIGHVNAKHLIISGTTFSGFAKAIHSNGGSFRAYSPTFNANSIIVIGAIADGGFILGADGENNTQIISGLQGVGTVTFELLYSRFDNMLGGQAVSGSTSNAPVIDSAVSKLIVEGCNFGGGGNFTSDFLKGDINNGSIRWMGNHVYNGNDSAFPMPDALLVAGLNTFAWWVDDTNGIRVGGSRVGSGVSRSWVSYDSVTSTNNIAKLISIQGDPVGASIPSNGGLFTCAQNSICLGAGEAEIAGLRTPTSPMLTIVGTPGATGWTIAIVALDANGNRTFLSYPVTTNTANATLSGSNKIVVTFPAVAGAASYDILRNSTVNNAFWGLAANQAASGTGVQTYNVVANFGGPYTYPLPTYNETASIIQRGSVATTVTATTATYSVKPSDSVLTCDATAGNYTVTLPAAATGNKGREYSFKRIDGSGNLPTISGGGTNIDGAATYTGLSAQWKHLTVKSNGGIWIIVANN